MDPLGTAALIATVLVTVVAGVALRRRDGRVRRGNARGGWALAGLVPGDGDRVLLLQLSSPVCTPCRRTAELLAGIRDRHDGVVHREVDVSLRPDLARVLDVLRTPTVVVFDRAGTELMRVSGVPRPADLEAALA